MTKILYVEDNPDNIYMLERRLKRRGYKVLIAVDGEAGLEMAAAEMPDIILMDSIFPGSMAGQGLHDVQAAAGG